MKSYNKYNLLLLIIFSFYVADAEGQDIKLLTDESQLARNIEEREIVRDVNGEICSLAIIYSDIAGIKYYSNLGVEKIDNDSTSYQVWFPSASKSIKLVVPGFSLYEHTLPDHEEPTVYIFILEVPERDTLTTYKEARFENVSFISTLDRVYVYEGERYIGQTPLSLTYFFNESTPEIKLVKYGYLTKSVSWDTLNPGAVYDISMVKQSHQKRYFVMPSVGFLYDYYVNVWGLSVGKLGKTGYYISAKYTNSDIPDEYYDNKVKAFIITAGISKSIAKATSLYIGMGYCSLDDQNSIPENRTQFNRLCIDYGLIKRTKGHMVFTLQSNFYANFAKIDGSNGFDISLGVGWEF